MYNVTRI